MKQFLGPSDHAYDPNWKPDPDDVFDVKEHEGYYPIPGLDPNMKAAGVNYKDIIQDQDRWWNHYGYGYGYGGNYGKDGKGKPPVGKDGKPVKGAKSPKDGGNANQYAYPYNGYGYWGNYGGHEQNKGKIWNWPGADRWWTGYYGKDGKSNGYYGGYGGYGWGGVESEWKGKYRDKAPDHVTNEDGTPKDSTEDHDKLPEVNPAKPVKKTEAGDIVPKVKKTDKQKTAQKKTEADKTTDSAKSTDAAKTTDASKTADASKSTSFVPAELQK